MSQRVMHRLTARNPQASTSSTTTRSRMRDSTRWTRWDSSSRMPRPHEKRPGSYACRPSCTGSIPPLSVSTAPQPLLPIRGSDALCFRPPSATSSRVMPIVLSLHILCNAAASPSLARDPSRRPPVCNGAPSDSPDAAHAPHPRVPARPSGGLDRGGTFRAHIAGPNCSPSRRTSR